VLLILLVIALEETSGETIIVAKDGSGDYDKIQDAIDNASNRDAIRVYEGTYYENVLVNKSLTLIGNGSFHTIINAGAIDSSVKITADWVNLSSFMIKRGGQYNWDAGILIESNYNQLYDINCTANKYEGIYLKSSDHNIIFNVTSNSNKKNGIFLSSSHNNLIYNCRFEENTANGICVEYSHNNSIFNNTFQSNTASDIESYSSRDLILKYNEMTTGIEIYGSPIETLTSHSIGDTNTVNGKPVFYYSEDSRTPVPLGAGQLILAGCHDMIISNQNISNINIGLMIAYSTNITINHNRFSGNDIGIDIYHSDNCTITNNVCNNNNRYGIFVRWQSTDITVSNNTANNNDYGLFVNEVGSVSIVSNNCSDNYFNGFLIQDLRNIELKNNICYSNMQNGFSFNDANECIILQNMIVGNNNGIYIENSKNIGISINTFKGNEVGITIDRSSNDNIIDKNYFINNNKSGIVIDYYSDNTIITNNTITGNGNGISITDSSEGTEVFHNNISKNSKYGIDASENNGKFIQATYNWWGDSSGPYHIADNPNGLGDNITNDVEFNPWNDAPIKFLFACIMFITPNPAVINDNIYFEGGAIGESIKRYAWRSDIDGEFYNGTQRNLHYDDLSLGHHNIHFKVMDESDVWSDEVYVSVIITERPIAIINYINPNPASDFDEIKFNGTWMDDEGIIKRHIWTSDLDGEFYNGIESGFRIYGLSIGTHFITYKVMDNHGIWSNGVSKELIIHKRPNATVISISPNPGLYNAEIKFKGKGLDDGNIMQYCWYSDIDGELYNGTSDNFTITNLSLGNHNITLRVQDNFGVWSDAVRSILLVYQLPIADFLIHAGRQLTIGPYEWETYENEEIVFNASPGSGEVNFTWDFGDNTTITKETPTTLHEYNSIGTYDINLTVFDDYGNSDTIYGRIVIVQRPKAILEIKDADTGLPLYPDYRITVGQEIIFDASNSKGDINTYFFGINLINAFIPQVQSDFPTYTLSYDEVGQYRAGLRVVDNLGNMSQMEKDDFIHISVYTKPEAEIIEVSPDPAIEGETVTFIGNGTVDGTIERYAWRTEDRELSNGTISSITVFNLSVGTHTIFLKVQDNYGVWSEEVSQVFIILKDTDGDRIPDINDAFINDAAASKDTDGDGYPDEWNEGKTAEDSSTGLKLDEYPDDSKIWEKDDDGDGFIPGFEAMAVVGAIGISIVVHRRKGKKE